MPRLQLYIDDDDDDYLSTKCFDFLLSLLLSWFLLYFGNEYLSLYEILLVYALFSARAIVMAANATKGKESTINLNFEKWN
jgi:hypothetical protein